MGITYFNFMGFTYIVCFMDIGDRIKKIRGLRQFSQGELARRVGVTQPTVSGWETGKTEPTIENLRALAVELEVWFEWMATGRGEQDYRPSAGASQEYRQQAEMPGDERKLQAIYRKLTPARRRALLAFLAALA